MHFTHVHVYTHTFVCICIADPASQTPIYYYSYPCQYGSAATCGLHVYGSSAEHMKSQWETSRRPSQILRVRESYYRIRLESLKTLSRRKPRKVRAARKILCKYCSSCRFLGRRHWYVTNYDPYSCLCSHCLTVAKCPIAEGIIMVTSNKSILSMRGPRSLHITSLCM